MYNLQETHSCCEVLDVEAFHVPCELIAERDHSVEPLLQQYTVWMYTCARLHDGDSGAGELYIILTVNRTVPF